jgi:hypothetical protein
MSSKAIVMSKTQAHCETLMNRMVERLLLVFRRYKTNLTGERGPKVDIYIYSNESSDSSNS